MSLKAKSTRLALVILAALSAQSALAEEKNQLTIVSDFYPLLIRNFNPYLSTNLRTTTDFVYESLVIFNQMHGNNKPIININNHPMPVIQNQMTVLQQL